MNKTQLLREYHRHSKADYYLIGFEYKGTLWLASINKIMPRYTAITYTSHKNGHKRKLQLNLSSKVKRQLVKHSIPLGNMDLLKGGMNKGIELEKLIYGLYGQKYKGHNNIPFYKDGDININGLKVQVKFENAQIVLENTIKKLNKVNQ